MAKMSKCENKVHFSDVKSLMNRFFIYNWLNFVDFEIRWGNKTGLQSVQFDDNSNSYGELIVTNPELIT